LTHRLTDEMGQLRPRGRLERGVGIGIGWGKQRQNKNQARLQSQRPHAGLGAEGGQRRRSAQSIPNRSCPGPLASSGAYGASSRSSANPRAAKLRRSAASASILDSREASACDWKWVGGGRRSEGEMGKGCAADPQPSASASIVGSHLHTENVSSWKRSAWAQSGSDLRTTTPPGVARSQKPRVEP
jgi:hypothetical protein